MKMTGWSCKYYYNRTSTCDYKNHNDYCDPNLVTDCKHYKVKKEKSWMDDVQGVPDMAEDLSDFYK